MAAENFLGHGGAGLGQRDEVIGRVVDQTQGRKITQRAGDGRCPHTQGHGNILGARNILFPLNQVDPLQIIFQGGTELYVGHVVLSVEMACGQQGSADKIFESL